MLSALRVDTVSADYVLMIDTSSSMAEDGRYSRVRAAAQPFLAALSPKDHLSLLTFDTAPDLRYSAVVGSSAASALHVLPPQAAGRGTDIGAALDAGLTELERPGASEVAALIVITDGKIDAAGSPYADVNAAAWGGLRSHAEALARHKTLVSFALALTDTTDASVVKQVLPSTLVVSLPADQVPPFLQRVKDRVRIAKATKLLDEDRGGRVTATWIGSLGNLDLKHGSISLQLRLTSTYRHLPVTLTGLTGQVAGLASARVGGLPGTVELKPGRTVTLPAVLHYPSPGGFHFPAKTIPVSGRLQLAAGVETPWQAQLEDLGVPVSPKLDKVAAPLGGTATIGLTVTRLVLYALAGLALLLLLGGWGRSVGPRLRGVLAVSRDGAAVLDAVALRGRRAKLGKGPLRPLNGVASGKVRGVERKSPIGRRREPGIRCVIRSGRRTYRFVLWPGDRRKVGTDLEFDYSD